MPHKLIYVTQGEQKVNSEHLSAGVLVTNP